MVLIEYSTSYCIVMAEMYCRDYTVETSVNTATTKLRSIITTQLLHSCG